MSTLLRGLNNRSIYQGEIDPMATVEALTEGLDLARRLGLRYWTLSFSNGVGFNNFRLGNWDQAVETLREALADEPAREDRAALLDNATLMPAFRGEDVTSAIAELTALVGSSTDLSFAVNLHEARGSAALAAGQLAEAYADFRVTAESNSSVSSTDARASAAHAAFWAGDVTGAAGELSAIEAAGFRAPAVEARKVMIRAGLAAAAGRRAESLGLYREAFRRWRELGLVLDEALCGIDMATLLDPAEPEVRAAAESTREILVRLRAAPLLARLDAAIGRPMPTAEPAVPRDLLGV
jgi:tetratricopeptide (TPR) repeat protein